jgi:hypothetical protein
MGGQNKGYWGPDQFIKDDKKTSIFPKKDPGNMAGGWVGGERGVKQFAARGENVADEDEQDALAPIIVGLAFIGTVFILGFFSLKFI